MSKLALVETRQQVNPEQQLVVAATQELPAPTQPVQEPHSPLAWQQVLPGHAAAPGAVQALHAPASTLHTGADGELQTIWSWLDAAGQEPPAPQYNGTESTSSFDPLTRQPPGTQAPVG